MKRLITILTIALLAAVGYSQNVVQNPGLEYPTSGDIFQPAAYAADAANWFSIDAGTVPDNAYGVQSPHAGQAFAGLHAWHLYGTQQVNYLSGTISPPLVAGEQYEFSMWVSLSDESRLAAPALQVYFSQRMPLVIDSNIEPQLWQTGQPVMEKEGWQKIGWTFTATDPWARFTVANFNYPPTGTSWPQNSGTLDGAFYYLDDFCLVQVGGECSSMVEMTEQNYQRQLQLQFSMGKIIGRNIPPGRHNLAVTDISGKQVLASHVFGPEFSLDFERRGLYLVQVDAAKPVKILAV